MAKGSANVPDGYETPSFPSISTPYIPYDFRKVLYYKSDVIGFVMLWSMYINIAICVISSLFTFISIKNKTYIPIILLVYAVYGVITGIVNGFLFGYAFWYIIHSLEFTVITLHPLFLGIIQGAIFRILEFPNIRMNIM